MLKQLKNKIAELQDKH